MMKLFLISQDDENKYWDYYDSAVVATESADDAKKIHPDIDYYEYEGAWVYACYNKNDTFKTCISVDDGDCWPRYKDRDCINVKYLGETSLQRGGYLCFI